MILERLARGGGTANWYFVRSEQDLGQVAEQFQGGSCVSFYFEDQLQVEDDVETAHQKMFDAVSPAREIMIGYPEVGRVDLDVELVTGPSELAEFLVIHPEGKLVVWGTWPSREGDPHGTITMDLVDADGVLRRHPH